jgi:predicted nucleotidyltransferase
MDDPLAQFLSQIARDLSDAHARFAMVGGLAISARVQPRFTGDIDLAVAVDSDEQAESIAGHLIRCGYRPILEIDHTPSNRLATLRFYPPDLPPSLEPDEVPLTDIIFCTCGIESEIVASAQTIPIYPDLSLPTARIAHLIAMKLLSECDARLQDRIDLQNLFAAATEADLSEVLPLLDLITQRGFSREKDLHATFNHFRDTNHS